ncbi:MAG: hypothetical protein HQ580_13380 [Planctomycetes bacterium]|nr:hypothetical protein [Planctomycetota bacterium]
MKLTPRERFNRSMQFLSTDRLPLLYWGAWDDTRRRWEKEGMTDYKKEFAGFDGPMQVCWLYSQFQGPIPPFEEKTLQETEEYADKQNYVGQVVRTFKQHTSMPYFMEYPVKSRSDWNKYRKRLDPSSHGRYPENWELLVRKRKAEQSGEIRGLAVWGFYAFPREMFGPEKLSLMFYDDSSLIMEMNEYWADFSIRRLKRAVEEMDFDYALIWEDNCYNHGMLHSPKIFQDFMAPFYRKLIDFFRKNGVEIISVDSDGNVSELIPLLLDVGVTALHPFEVAAGMDVVKIGRDYPQLQIWGGIDKRVLARGPRAIDAELERVILPMKKRGGYATGLDHGIPSDVSLENHRYYVKKLREMSYS